MQPREAHELKGLADIVEQSKQKLFSSKFTERFKVNKNPPPLHAQAVETDLHLFP
jgi:hypothetical protein